MGQKERDEELARITKDTDEPNFVIPVSTHPLPAEIVSDARDTWPRRVPIIALILILLYFSIGGADSICSERGSTGQESYCPAATAQDCAPR